MPDVQVGPGISVQFPWRSTRLGAAIASASHAGNESSRLGRRRENPGCSLQWPAPLNPLVNGPRPIS